MMEWVSMVCDYGSGSCENGVGFRNEFEIMDWILLEWFDWESRDPA